MGGCRFHSRPAAQCIGGVSVATHDSSAKSLSPRVSSREGTDALGASHRLNAFRDVAVPTETQSVRQERKPRTSSWGCAINSMAINRSAKTRSRTVSSAASMSASGPAKTK